MAAGGWAGRETFLVVALYIEETIHHWRPVLNLRLLPCRRRIGVCVQSTPPQHWLPVACDAAAQSAPIVRLLYSWEWLHNAYRPIHLGQCIAADRAIFFTTSSSSSTDLRLIVSILTRLFTARCTLVQSAVLPSHVVCLSVRPSVHLWRWWIVIT